MAHFSIPEHTLIGSNAMKEAIPFLKKCGKKALIVTGPHVVNSPMMEELMEILAVAQIDYEVFSGISGEPTDEMIAEGTKIFHDSKCKFVIGIGGGSPLDSAKAITVMSKSKKRIADFLGKEITGSYPPIVAIPTTAGTGSEATKFTVITDKQTEIKMLLKGECLIPKIAILKTEFTEDMPKGITAATGLDALTHAIEAYTSKKAMAFTDTFAISAVKRIMKYLPIAYHNGYNKEAREQMALAAYEAGICINNSSVTIVHGMSRPIGALFHIPHGKSNAMLLKLCLGFALSGTYERFATLGREIGAANETEPDRIAAEKFLEAVSEVVKICEIPTLTEYGIKKEDFENVIEKMSKDAVDSGSPANTRREVTIEDCMSIYKKLIEL